MLLANWADTFCRYFFLLVQVYSVLLILRFVFFTFGYHVLTFVTKTFLYFKKNNTTVQHVASCDEFHTYKYLNHEFILLGTHKPDFLDIDSIMEHKNDLVLILECNGDNRRARAPSI